jgi:bifunctional DNA-binding transcriptional regulator/antitoxin component of YhaV-PrlF toxin-antitoxin module
MIAPIHIHIGKDRRIAIPAQFCEESNIHPGDGFLLGRQGNQLVLTPLTDEAERMRRELRELLGKDADLMDDLRDMRDVDAADEARHR